jgi:UDP-3-O-[3-hydroxymyristoyl] glucosamine N-acyltransferase
MYRLKRADVWASEIAQYLNRELQGEDFVLEDPYSIRTPAILARAKGLPAAGGRLLLIAGPQVPAQGYAAVIVSDRPESDFASVLLEFFASERLEGIHPTAQVAPSAHLRRGVVVGPGAVVGDDVEVGDGTRILANAQIYGPARLGAGCLIKDGAVIGTEGYGFVREADGRLVHQPQLGRIFLGDRVWVGANSTVERALIHDTVLEDDVKIDDLAHVGNGTRVGRGSLVTAGVVLAFDVTLGQRVTLGPGVTVRERASIADDVVVGAGAVVVNDLTRPGVYVGVPARFLKEEP